MDRCTGRCNITEILLKMVLNTIQSIKLAFSCCSDYDGYYLHHAFTKGDLMHLQAA